MDTQYETRFAAARRAGTELARTDDATLSRAVVRAAALLRENTEKLLAANALDLAAMAADSPMRDRLRLTPERIAGIASDMESVAGLPAPQGATIDEWSRPNGMTVRKIRVPFGVVGMVCEARPNVTADIFSLCLKTGNACVLKGGSDARHSNEAIAALLHEALRSEDIDPAAFTLLPSGHEAVAALLGAVGYVDVVIPRGGAGLIRFVRENARIPVIETGAGIVHTYFDAEGDLAKGRAIVCNAKTRRVSVCNALDCLIVHRDRLGDLAKLCDPMAARRVTIYADAEAYAALAGRYPACQLRPAEEEHFGTEFLDYKLAVKTVGSLDETLAHIERFSSRHSEAIITENAETARQFSQRVDAACVYVNVSTAFTDGGQFGFGAEVGISTQKLHARGPMGLPELTTYKYVVSGDGQTREP
ncbi:glutamate-5-semialdehyde dehydrogenase [Alistipes provencensis]|uniref:glutamate-5-semialdehyde dehydrogenase n=1 Tax=Alistipes provencensis TaxID=1816676 RepID=UPI0007EE01B2|nr:glutamate-5-semialdehyde dehydrogenase [Alistipes provencensis]